MGVDVSAFIDPESKAASTETIVPEKLEEIATKPDNTLMTGVWPNSNACKTKYNYKSRDECKNHLPNNMKEYLDCRTENCSSEENPEDCKKCLVRWSTHKSDIGDSKYGQTTPFKENGDRFMSSDYSCWYRLGVKCPNSLKGKPIKTDDIGFGINDVNKIGHLSGLISSKQGDYYYAPYGNEYIVGKVENSSLKMTKINNDGESTNNSSKCHDISNDSELSVFPNVKKIRIYHINSDNSNKYYNNLHALYQYVELKDSNGKKIEL